MIKTSLHIPVQIGTKTVLIAQDERNNKFEKSAYLLRIVRSRPSAARARADRGRCVAVRVRGVWRHLRPSGTAVGSPIVGRRGVVYNYQARLHRRCTAAAAAAAAAEIAQRLDAGRPGAVYHDELLTSQRRG